MSKKELAIGVLGAGGNIGHTHSQNIATYVDGARLAAVYDLNTERAEEVAKTYGAKVMASAEELIASPEIDAVVIASWDGTHADLAVKCIEAGKPVFCEKPLATTLEDAKKVVEAEKASGKRLLQIGFMRRFDPGLHQDEEDPRLWRAGCSADGALHQPYPQPSEEPHHRAAHHQHCNPRDRYLPLAAG